MKITTTLLAMMACSLVAVDGARILAIFPVRAKSHYNVYEPLLKRLSAKGHEVVAVTHFPQKKQLANFTDVDISSTLPSLIGTLRYNQYENSSIVEIAAFISRVLGWEICDPVLSYPEVKKIIQTREPFDLLIVESFVTDCFLGFAHALSIPKIIGVITSVPLPWSNDAFENPENPSYIPNWFTPYTGRMDFLERSINMLKLLITKLIHRYERERGEFIAELLEIPRTTTEFVFGRRELGIRQGNFPLRLVGTLMIISRINRIFLSEGSLREPDAPLKRFASSRRQVCRKRNIDPRMRSITPIRSIRRLKG